MDDADDAERIRRARAGDRAAFGELFGEYRVRAFRTALLMTRDRVLAEDITQEAFIRAYLAIGRCDPERPFLPWLLRILINLSRNACKQRKRLVSMEGLPEAGGPDDRFSASEERIVVWRALMQLDRLHREVLMLRYYHDFSDAETAEALDIPVGTVKSRLHTARRLLGQRLQLPDESRPPVPANSRGVFVRE
ncbi:MAG TPA: RNA polymerase sigma factor [Symbiobacteriaceae bacterium]